MTRQPWTVVKVGGSLFDWPDLPKTLPAWLQRQSESGVVLLAGGGPLAQSVRRWSDAYRLSESFCHWLCIDLLDVSSRLLHSLVPGSRLVDEVDDLQRQVAHRPAASPGGPLVLAPSKWLRRDRSLPEGWHVTSDSIAARLAAALEAGELVLLKSALPADGTTPDQWAAAGFVDRYFPPASAGLAAVRIVDLRRAEWPEIRWSSGHGSA